MQGKVAMMSGKETAYHTFFAFNLRYDLIFKLEKEIFTNWMKHIAWQILTHVSKDES